MLPYHFVMLTDLERLEVYGRAIRAAVEQQRKRLGRRPRVLDAGCGLGLLGIMAALEGAEVWLCEAMAPLRQMCRDVLAANTSGITESRGLCQLLPPMMSTRLRIGEDVEHQFDIVVSEVLDLWCLGEGVIPTMRHAHKKLLAPGGELLPNRLAIFAQPVELNLWERAEQEHGIKLKALGTFYTKFMPMRLQQYPCKWLTEKPAPVLEIDLADVPSQVADGEPNLEGAPLCIRMGGKPALSAKVSAMAIERKGTLTGYGIWWAADLGHGEVITNAPQSPQRSWKQLMRCLDKPRAVEVGESVQVLACYSETQMNLDDVYLSEEMKAQYQQAVLPEGLHHTAVPAPASVQLPTEKVHQVSSPGLDDLEEVD